MDILSTKDRSEVMRMVRAKNTKPELRVRRALHALGYRYRLHVKGLPGNPDIVFRKYKTVVFVHGCFWHRHARCKKTRMPKSNCDFWNEKFRNNVQRDILVLQEYEKIGWNVVVIWECETEIEDKMEQAIKRVISCIQGP